MDSDQGKLFVGGISWETDEDKLREHFSSYGDVSQAIVMRDKLTGRPRGFGFVIFSDPSLLDRVLQDKHHIDSREVDVKRAMSREEQQVSGRSGSFNATRGSGGDAYNKTKKIFVGGLPPTLTDEEFRLYFEQYGPVADVVIMHDQTTSRPRGFGFVSFDSEDAVDRVLQKNFHDLNGKQVEVKRALPKDANPGGAGRAMGGGGGGGYQGFGGSEGGFDGRMDFNRYMQPQNVGNGLPSYGGSSGYAAGGGYGNGSNGAGFGGYGGYGAGAGAAYGATGMPGGGYGSSVAPRNAWDTPSAPSGYGNPGGYGNGAAQSGYGAPPAQTQYGYGGYSGSGEAGYGNQAAYGAVGGRPSVGGLNNPGGGYMGGYDPSQGYGLGRQGQ
ncbi:heterogeneous nuclear ribonucleoprotein 1 [Brassica rapa]|uniref:RRM domain-containing protein n=1 Tax=Brassica campestris TaxID=3711 RepID=M4D2Q4_BRACM|nr:heterogeneous nuclear ribonucleoprotein 1 [Brassica rapa]